ncbi:MAG: chloride channel protein [Desulfobacterales bacterium]|nr:chloride channel protein [Desulfobacterales bacterium]
MNTAGLYHRITDTFRLNEHTIILIIASVIGFIGGFGAVLFRWLIDFFQTLATGRSSDILETVRALAWYHKLLLPVIGGMIVGPLVHFLGKETKGHGVPEVMEAVALRGGRIRARVMFIKILVSAVTIATGGSVGREGPIVQIGSGMGSVIGQFLKSSKERMQVLVACGAAAGIAASFNAPIAGVIFSVEIILGNYAITTLVPLIMSSVMATIVGRWYFGDIPAFEIPRYSLVNAWEIAPYILLGIAVGFLAVGFIRVLYAIEDLGDKVPMPGWMKAPVFLFLIGLIVLYFPQVYGVGYDTITQVLKADMVWYMLLILIPVKMLATSITLGAGGSGGVFAPSLFLGSVFGGLFGTLGHMLFPAVMASPGGYAVVGMSAMVAGTTHAPITAFLIIFEMTGDYKLILPLMLCSILASFVASRLLKDSIYTMKLSRRGVDLAKGMEVAIMQTTKVRDVLHQDMVTIHESADFSDVLQKVIHANESNYYVVDDDGRFQGSLSVHDVKEFLNDKSLSGIVVAKDLVSVSESPSIVMDATLAECMRKFGTFYTEELPVVDNMSSNKLVGTVSRRDIINVYNREILRQESLGLKFIQSKLSEKSPARSYVSMPAGFEINVIPVPPGMQGRTLKELDIRNRYSVSVVSINRRGERGQRDVIIPEPENILKKTDMLVVIGKLPDLKRLKMAFNLPA